MSELFAYRLDDAIVEVERELRLRGTFYGRRVQAGRMKPELARQQIGRLEAARGFLLELRTLKGGNHEHSPPRDEAGAAGTLAG